MGCDELIAHKEKQEIEHYQVHSIPPLEHASTEQTDDLEQKKHDETDLGLTRKEAKQKLDAYTNMKAPAPLQARHLRSVSSIEYGGCNKKLKLKPPHRHHDDMTVVEETLANIFFRDYYAKFILHPISKVAVGIIYVLYLAISIYGTFMLQEGLEPQNLVTANQPFQPYIRELGRSFYEQGIVL
jgi:hypothetical protein